MTRHISYCRMCSGVCGVIVEVEDGRATRVEGDRDHPLTGGFTCAKGRRLGDFHADPERLRVSQRRVAPGVFEPVEAHEAIREIGARLGALVEAHGASAVGFFSGTQALTASLTPSFARGWFRALGSPRAFSTMTIDQSAKWVAWGRLGTWAGGRQRFEDSDVWLLAGSNPLVSLQGGILTGFPVQNPWKRLRDARRRGLALIVVDPRRSEIAAQADVHLQLVPGTDAALFAGLLHVILEEHLEDADFCSRHARGLEALRAAVRSVDPERAAALTGLAAEQIVEAARIFGRARRGMAMSGTGPDMGPAANVSEHLIQALNVVCGRFPRAGDRVASAGMLSGPAAGRAEVVPPSRGWERGYRTRDGQGLLLGELPSALLPELILDPEEPIRALVVVGGNPANAFPDPERVVGALERLELLVSIDPYMTETARLAHYVIAPALSLERPDDTRGYEHFYSQPFAQYTPALLERPPGVIEDWEFFFHLASEMGLTLQIGSNTYPPGGAKPTSDELLARYARRARISHDELRRGARGMLFDQIEPDRVLPASPDARGRFDLFARDVASELEQALGRIAVERADRPYRLIARRARETMNSLGRRLPGLPRHPYNPCFVHPQDLESLGIPAGARVTLTSDHGRVDAIAEPDPTLRRGAISLVHGYGDLPGRDDDPRLWGSNPARLLSLSRDVQDISRMPLMTAVPVQLQPADESA